MPTPPQTPGHLSHLPGDSESALAKNVTVFPFLNNEPKSDQPTTATTNSTRRRRRDDGHVRRPANPFILFAAEFRRSMENKGKSNRELSKEAGTLWKIMPAAEKSAWMERATAVKEKHAEEHPDYRYQPRRRIAGSLDALSGMPNELTIIMSQAVPGSMPRKSGARSRRTAVKGKKTTEAERAATEPSGTGSTSRLARKRHARTKNSTELSPIHAPFMTTEPTLLPAAIAPPSLSAERLAGSSSQDTSQSSSSSNNDISFLFEPWSNHTQQIDQARWTIDPFSISSVAPAVWDQPCMPRTDRNEVNQQNSMAGCDSASFFAQYPYGNSHIATSNLFDPFCNSFASNNGSSNGS